MNAGRHRNFDKDIALDKAMEVFWKNGYAGTSLTHLTDAMGINKPSLYSTFGNKEALYKSSLERYVQKHGIIHATHLSSANTSVQKKIQGYLMSIAEMLTTPSLPGGCFVCVSTCEMVGSGLPSDALQTIGEINELTKSSLVEFFNAEKQRGNVTSKHSATVMANYVLSQQFGLSVMARNGATLNELNDIIKFFVSKF